MRSEDVLILEIEAFIAMHALAETSFCKMAVGDPTTLRRLRSGRSVTLETADRLRSFMSTYVPKDAKPRPKPETGVAA
jgi:hypothetical protein